MQNPSILVLHPIYTALEEAEIRLEDALDHVPDVTCSVKYLHRSADEKVLREHMREANIILGFANRKLLKEATSLSWLHLPSAGADAYCDRSLYHRDDILLTNSSGVYGTPIAEHILGMMLAFCRGINGAIRKQARAEWGCSEYSDSLVELSGTTLGIIGLGDIGRALAVRAKAMGMYVLGVRRRPVSPEYPIPEGVDEIFGEDGVPETLSRSDHVALCLPSTNRTKGLIGPERLRLMKPTAYIYNVGRGDVLDEKALIEALLEKRLAGAGLDVFETEPVPSESPLWRMTNVIVSPHISGISPLDTDRILSIFMENLRRYISGSDLINVVDIDESY